MRKDLTALQEQGLVKRTHGGALALRPIVGRGRAGNEEERDHQRGIYLGKEEEIDSSSEQGEGR